jgi:hypothetical protein
VSNPFNAGDANCTQGLSGAIYSNWTNDANNGFAKAATVISAASNGATLPTGTINVVTTAGFDSSGTIKVVSSNGTQTITYTNITGTSFTGCSGGTGTLSTGGLVTEPGLNTAQTTLVKSQCYQFALAIAAQYSTAAGDSGQTGQLRTYVAHEAAVGTGNANFGTGASYRWQYPVAPSTFSFTVLASGGVTTSSWATFAGDVSGIGVYMPASVAAGTTVYFYGYLVSS